jgi:predicted nucleic acid-binding protein
LGLLTEIGAGPVGLDSAVFIYFIERDPRYLATVKPVFTAIADGRLEGVTSSLSLLETMVVPLRLGNEVVARQYERFLTGSRGLEVIPINFALLRAAAHLRAVHRLKTPDAIQAASAITGGCSTFVTNDHRIPSLPGLRVLQLENYPEP